MPLSAAFHFFSPFHYKKKLLHQSLSPQSLLSLLSFFPHFGETSFGTYIRNLAHYTIKYNKSQATYTANRNHP